LYEHDASLPEADTLDYFEHRPAEWLTPFVRCIWMLREADGAGEPVPERVLPDGCVETILHLGAPFRARAADGSWQTQPEAFLVGRLRGLLYSPRLARWTWWVSAGGRAAPTPS
jgi:hypothetical protein